MKPERFTARVFLCVIMGMMMFAVLSLGVKQTAKLTDDTAKIITIDWEKLYPFEDGEIHSVETKKESLYEYVKRKLEEYTSEYFMGYHKIVEVSRRYEDIVRWNMVSVFDYNAIMRLHDGYLTTYTASLDVSLDAEAVKEFADFCAERGIDFMYMNFPTKVCVSEDKEICGVLDFANQNADKFLAMLTESGVRNYDFRKNLHDEGMNHHKAFFVTDHHWKPETGLWAARHILEILRGDLGWDVKPDILRPENFRYEIYRDWFLGSEGKKVTLARAKPDDFTMIYPKFGTALNFEVPSLELSLSGDFGIIYNMEHVEIRDYYNKNSYAVYNYGDKPLIRIGNRLTKDGKRILVIHDSFSNSVIPFVALGIQYIDAIDLRHFTGSVRSFVDTEKPDAVIVMYYSALAGRFEKNYDFR